MSPDGSRVFVTGQSYDLSSDYTTIAYDAASGALLWLQRFDGESRAWDYSNSLAVSPDGAVVFVTGQSWGADQYDYVTVAYGAPTGHLLWARRYSSGHGRDGANVVAVSPDGSTVFVTGESPGATGIDDYATLAYDAATGAVLWLRRYNGPGNADDEADSMSVSPDSSRVYVTGFSTGADGTDDYATVAYDSATGAALWLRRYRGPGDGSDDAESVTASPDGSSVFVTGFSLGAGGNYDYATVAYDAATGASSWLRRYDGPGNDADLAEAMSVSPDGSEVFVAGFSVGAEGDYDYATVAYDAGTGASRWLQRYDGAAHSSDVVYAMTASPDGSKVFVTGFSYEIEIYPDYATVAYEAGSGAPVWLAVYEGPDGGTDIPNGIAVSPDGASVFVTGQSVGSGGLSDDDFATVAYGLTA